MHPNTSSSLNSLQLQVRVGGWRTERGRGHGGARRRVELEATVARTERPFCPVEGAPAPNFPTPSPGGQAAGSCLPGSVLPPEPSMPGPPKAALEGTWAKPTGMPRCADAARPRGPQLSIQAGPRNQEERTCTPKLPAPPYPPIRLHTLASVRSRLWLQRGWKGAWSRTCTAACMRN